MKHRRFLLVSYEKLSRVLYAKYIIFARLVFFKFQCSFNIISCMILTVYRRQ